MTRAARIFVAVGAVAGAAVALKLTVLSPKPVQVAVVAVERGVVEEIVANTRAGTVKARHRAQLSPQTGGRVVELLVEKGDPVKTGQLLLRLDDSIQRANLQLAEKDLHAARAKAKEICLASELAARDANRLKQLFEAGVVSHQMYDQAETERERLEAACSAAKAAVASAEARLELARSELDLTRLFAPFDGIVADVSTEVGEWITPSPPGVPIPPVIDLIDMNSIYITAPVDEVDSAKVKVGQEARVSLDPFPEKKFPAIVVKVAPYVEDKLEQNRTLDVELEFAGGVPADVLPGTSADVEILVSQKEGVLRIPTSSVDSDSCVLVLSEGKLVKKKVEVGLSNWKFSEVVSGLRAGELVVVVRDRKEIREGVRAVASSSD